MMGLQVAASKRKYEIGACTDLNDIQPNCTPAKNPRIDDSQQITTTTTSSSTSETSLQIQITQENEEKEIEKETRLQPIKLLDVTVVHQSTTITTTSTSSLVSELSSVQNESTSTINGETKIESNDERVKSTKTSEINTQLTGRGHELTLAKLNTVSIPTSNGHAVGSWSNGTTTDDDEAVIDPISKLQAVAVPDEAWGGVESTRSTLATTLLPPDDLDEDIDDFEDDYDDDDSMLSYGPPRYIENRCVPFTTKEYTPPPFPKYPEQYHNQNCSRTPPPSAAYNRYGSWNNQYYHNEPMPISDPPQTIRCAENGKSYTELGTYTFFNSNTTRHIKRCCDGKNNWCNNKQCYKEKRIRMMNLSMFKLSRFRQASDQSLYRSVLICNTLKAIEKEIDTEKRQAHQLRRQISQMTRDSNIMLASINVLRNSSLQKQAQQQQQQQTSSDYASGPHSIISSNNDSNSNVSSYRVNGVIDPVSDITNHNNEQQKRNEYSENNPNSSNTSSNNLLNNGSNYLQSYTNHNRIYGGNPTGFESIPPPPQQPYEYHPLKDPQSGRATPFPASGGYPDTDSGYGEDGGDLSPGGQFRSINWGSVLSLSSQSALDPLNNNELFSSSHTSPYITSNSCGSSFNTSLSSTTTTNYLDMDLGYDVLPNCYKLTSFGTDDFLRTPLMEPSKVVYDGHDNMPDTFSTHIMVGS